MVRRRLRRKKEAYVLIRFDAEKAIASKRHDVWGSPRVLSASEEEGIRVGMRFIRSCYYALLALLAVSVVMIGWLAMVP